MKKQYNFEELLRLKGEKVTKARVEMLTVLSKERYPLSIKEIALRIKAPDQSTLYRTLTTLVEKGFVKEIVLDKASARYEILIGREHHHHIVCTSCGFIEDINACQENENKMMEEKSKGFAQITGHTLEFFGVCRTCAN